jgi:hypothetical protein
MQKFAGNFLKLRDYDMFEGLLMFFSGERLEVGSAQKARENVGFWKQ